MKTIYCLQEWDKDMKLSVSELFMSIEGVANWLTKKDANNNVFHVKDRETEGYYSINAKNIKKILEASERIGMAAAFTIERDFYIQTIETKYTLSKIDVNE